MSAPPVVPPRPTRATAPEEPSSPGLPAIPPRPARNRSKSPLPEASNTGGTVTSAETITDAEEPSFASDTKSPSVRFEEPLASSIEDLRLSNDSPEQRRSIDPNLDLHHPTAVSTGSQKSKNRLSRVMSQDKEVHEFPPEIGQRVPMLAHAGDVQAPSPKPHSRSASRNRNHRKSGQFGPSGQPQGHEGEMVIGGFGAYPTGLHAYKQGGTYSLSSEDLNLSVMKAQQGAGLATTPGLHPVPDEEFAYIATEEYTSRHGTPLASPGIAEKPFVGLGHVISPLARETLSTENDDSHQLHKVKSNGQRDSLYKSTLAQASSSSLNIPSGAKTPEGWTGINVADFQDERHEGTPILASDELNKSTHFLPPAVSPRMSPTVFRRQGSISEAIKKAQPNQDVEEDELDEPTTPQKEHEPLFPESPKDEHHLRPKLDKAHRSSHRFPSKDIWEDAPESTRITYEVKTPEVAPADDDDAEPGEEDISKTTGLDDEVVEAKEKQAEEQHAKEILNQDTEDRSVAIGKDPSTSNQAMPPPPIPNQRPQRRTQSTVDEATTTDSKPLVESSPISPISPLEKKAPPTIPDRPKPHIPARPVRQTSLEKAASDSTTVSPDTSKPPPPAPKPKPMVPPKVGGGIAALRANFMNDLNSRLSKGPVPPPKKEEVVEASEPKEQEPLEDVRKGRARGPTRRKPPTSAAAADTTTKAVVCSLVPMITLFHITEEGDVTVHQSDSTEMDSKTPMEQTLTQDDNTTSIADIDTAKEAVMVSPEPQPALTTSQSEPVSHTNEPVSAAPTNEPLSAIEPSHSSLESIPSDLQPKAAVTERSDILHLPAVHPEDVPESILSSNTDETPTSAEPEQAQHSADTIGPAENQHGSGTASAETTTLQSEGDHTGNDVAV